MGNVLAQVSFYFSFPPPMLVCGQSCGNSSSKRDEFARTILPEVSHWPRLFVQNTRTGGIAPWNIYIKTSKDLSMPFSNTALPFAHFFLSLCLSFPVFKIRLSNILPTGNLKEHISGRFVFSPL
jgi:hypothetical protein